MSDLNEWNRQIIEEFRANGGRVGGPFEGAPMLLLHHVGRRSGSERVNPLVHRPVGDAWAIFASAAGADKHPDWYLNLVDHPETTIEVGTEQVDVAARVLPSDERDPVWEAQKRDSPGFADYEAKTDRVIPVVLLERR